MARIVVPVELEPVAESQRRVAAAVRKTAQIELEQNRATVNVKIKLISELDKAHLDHLKKIERYEKQAGSSSTASAKAAAAALAEIQAAASQAVIAVREKEQRGYLTQIRNRVAAWRSGEEERAAATREAAEAEITAAESVTRQIAELARRQAAWVNAGAWGHVFLGRGEFRSITKMGDALDALKAKSIAAGKSILKWIGRNAAYTLAISATIKLASVMYQLQKRGLPLRREFEYTEQLLVHITGSAERAAAAMGSINDVAGSVPFERSDLIGSVITLERLGAGAFATEAGLTALSDAAIVADTTIDDAAERVGRLVQMLRLAADGSDESRRLVVEQVDAIAGLGIISQEAASQLADLAGGSAAAAAGIGIIRSELESLSGASRDVSETYIGLQRRLTAGMDELAVRVAAPLGNMRKLWLRFKVAMVEGANAIIDPTEAVFESEFFSIRAWDRRLGEITGSLADAAPGFEHPLFFIKVALQNVSEKLLEISQRAPAATDELSRLAAVSNLSFAAAAAQGVSAEETFSAYQRLMNPARPGAPARLLPQAAPAPPAPAPLTDGGALWRPDEEQRAVVDAAMDSRELARAYAELEDRLRSLEAAEQEEADTLEAAAEARADYFRDFNVHMALLAEEAELQRDRAAAQEAAAREALRTDILGHGGLDKATAELEQYRVVLAGIEGGWENLDPDARARAWEGYAEVLGRAEAAGAELGATEQKLIDYHRWYAEAVEGATAQNVAYADSAQLIQHLIDTGILRTIQATETTTAWDHALASLADTTGGPLARALRQHVALVAGIELAWRKVSEGTADSADLFLTANDRMLAGLSLTAVGFQAVADAASAMAAETNAATRVAGAAAGVLGGVAAGAPGGPVGMLIGGVSAGLSALTDALGANTAAQRAAVAAYERGLDQARSSLDLQDVGGALRNLGRLWFGGTAPDGTQHAGLPAEQRQRGFMRFGSALQRGHEAGLDFGELMGPLAGFQAEAIRQAYGWTLELIEDIRAEEERRLEIVKELAAAALKEARAVRSDLAGSYSQMDAALRGLAEAADSAFDIRPIDAAIERMRDLGLLTDEVANAYRGLADAAHIDWRSMIQTAEQFGIGQGHLGAGFEQARVSGLGGEIAQAFSSLTDAGGDPLRVAVGLMRTALDEQGRETGEGGLLELIRRAGASGALLPPELKPALDALASAGIEKEAISGVQYGKPLENMRKSLHDLLAEVSKTVHEAAIEQADAVIAGIEDLRDRELEAIRAQTDRLVTAIEAGRLSPEDIAAYLGPGYEAIVDGILRSAGLPAAPPSGGDFTFDTTAFTTALGVELAKLTPNPTQWQGLVDAVHAKHGLTQETIEALQPLEWPEGFNVDNWPEGFNITNWPELFNIGNWPAWPTSIAISNWPEASTFPTTFNIGNVDNFPITFNLSADTIASLPVTFNLSDSTIANLPTTFDLSSATIGNMPTTFSVSESSIGELQKVDIQNQMTTFDLSQSTIDNLPVTFNLSAATIANLPVTFNLSEATIEAMPTTFDLSQATITDLDFDTASEAVNAMSDRMAESIHGPHGVIASASNSMHGPYGLIATLSGAVHGEHGLGAVLRGIRSDIQAIGRKLDAPPPAPPPKAARQDIRVTLTDKQGRDLVSFVADGLPGALSDQGI